MVMEASGRSERKYCHCRGGGQRLMRTSRRLMVRSTERPTTTGTNSEPPCCKAGGRVGSTEHQCPHSATVTRLCGLGGFQRLPLPGHVAPVGHLWSQKAHLLSPSSPDRKQVPPHTKERVQRDLRPPSQRTSLASAAHHSQNPYLKAQLCCEWVISHGVHSLVQSQSLGIWRGLVKDRA